MSVARGIAFLFCALPWLAGCRDTPQARAGELNKVVSARRQQLAQRIAKAVANRDPHMALAQWIMPPQLREISGLVLTSRGTVLTHDDNAGRVYELDPKTGILLKGFSLIGNQKEDFEAITIAGDDIYLMASDGKLFRFREGADGQQVTFILFDPGLKNACEFEGLAYQSDSTRLLMVCKRVHDTPNARELRIYRLPLPLNRSTITAVKIPIDDVIGSNQWKDFRPSDIAIDPTTRNYVVIAAHEKGLAVLTPDGEVVRSEPLPGDHRQAEGVAVTRDSLLIISDEANVLPAQVTLYRWQP
jgi:uncharacterized protein YjiK